MPPLPGIKGNQAHGSPNGSDERPVGALGALVAEGSAQAAAKSLAPTGGGGLGGLPATAGLAEGGAGRGGAGFLNWASPLPTPNASNPCDGGAGRDGAKRCALFELLSENASGISCSSSASRNVDLRNTSFSILSSISKHIHNYLISLSDRFSSRK